LLSPSREQNVSGAVVVATARKYISPDAHPSRRTSAYPLLR
jgi:hypothetical protein